MNTFGKTGITSEETNIKSNIFSLIFFTVSYIQPLFIVCYVTGGVLGIGETTVVTIIMFYDSLIAKSRKAS